MAGGYGVRVGVGGGGVRDSSLTAPQPPKASRPVVLGWEVWFGQNGRLHCIVIQDSPIAIPFESTESARILQMYPGDPGRNLPQNAGG